MDKKIQYLNEIDRIIYSTMLYENFSKLSLKNQTNLIEHRLKRRRLNEWPDWLDSAASAVSDYASDAYDTVSDYASDAGDWVSDTASSAYDTVHSAAKKSTKWVNEAYDEWGDTFHDGVAWLQVGLAGLSLGAYATGIGAPVGWIASALDGCIDVGYAISAGIKGDYGEMSWRIGGAAFSFLGASALKGMATAGKVAKVADTLADTGKVVVKGFQASNAAVNTVKGVDAVGKVGKIGKFTNIISNAAGKVINTGKNIANTSKVARGAKLSHKAMAWFPKIFGGISTGGSLGYGMGANWLKDLPGTNPASWMTDDPGSPHSKIAVKQGKGMIGWHPNTLNYWMQPTDSPHKVDAANQVGVLGPGIPSDSTSTLGPVNPIPVNPNTYQDQIKAQQDSIQAKAELDSLSGNLNKNTPIGSTGTLKSGMKIVNGVPVMETARRRRRRYAW
jgi:hypothetical protein